jgi:hypothetical protein
MNVVYNIYIKKEILDIKYPDLTLLKNVDIKCSDNYYCITYNYKLYNRLVKIINIIKKESSFLEFIKYCTANSSSWIDMYNDMLKPL